MLRCLLASLKVGAAPVGVGVGVVVGGGGGAGLRNSSAVRALLRKAFDTVHTGQLVIAASTVACARDVGERRSERSAIFGEVWFPWLPWRDDGDTEHTLALQ